MRKDLLKEHVGFIEKRLDEGRFKAFVRYMVQAAKQKRCVPYYELENVFGLNHKDVGWYAGILGDLCMAWKWPLLNSLIISSTECIPSDGFTSYAVATKKEWAEHVQACWKRFHVTSTRKKQTQDYARLDSEVETLLRAPAEQLKDLPYFKA